jgi:hypothetical protein
MQRFLKQSCDFNLYSLKKKKKHLWTGFLKPSRKQNLQTVFSKPSIKKFIMVDLKSRRFENVIPKEFYGRFL